MPDNFVYKIYKADNDAQTVREKLTAFFLKKGYIQTGNYGITHFFRYPFIRFSSKKPLTCISRLSIEVSDQKSGSLVKMGVTFTKIRYFTIGIILLLCTFLPIVLGLLRNGVPDIPPMAFTGIPLGFWAYYHVRSRVFKVLGRLIKNIHEV